MGDQAQRLCELDSSHRLCSVTSSKVKGGPRLNQVGK